MSEKAPQRPRVPLNEYAQAAQRRREAVTVDPLPAVDGAPPERRERRPFGNRNQKLHYPERPGYHRHWFNDTPGRLLEAADAGYEMVMDPRGQPVSMVVGVNRGGGGLVAYLHETPEEWYREDMAAHDAEVHSRLGAIKHGEWARPAGADGANQYAKTDQISMVSRAGQQRR